MIESLTQQLRDQTSAQRKRRPASIDGFIAPTSIYQLKVTLRDSHPAIWRRIQVPDTILLPHLHGVLQLAMGWTNSHLHLFQVGELNFAEPSPDDDFPVIDYCSVQLNQVAPAVADSLVYLYDFGDSWEHDIVVEKILPGDTGTHNLSCLDGQRACPPEDVGGVWGYADFVKAIRNPRHPEHAEMLEWVGGAFDPDRLDLPGVNRMLHIFQLSLARQARTK
ncbi:MAG: plasmid pRiA4b ORF-3 family protein [Acidobacteria bacterium]|nr:plasmid pRiA4b ORF-3 family protein [Acidobacteriota bacterium]